MARRSRSSPAEDIMTLVARLPWWAGIGLALISYMLLHSVATPDPSLALQPKQLGQFVIQTYVKAAANIGQYLLPVICIVGAAVSAWQRNQRKALVVDTVQKSAANALDDMAWHEFEMLVGEAFRMKGYQVAETGGNGPDGGIDLVLSKGKEKFLVQCKQWKALKVSVMVVRELYGVMAAKGATGGFVVTSGRFTKDAFDFASGRNIELIDGAKLLTWIKAAVPKMAVMPTQLRTAASNPERVVVTCPSCQGPMVRRSAARGANAGKSFLGCAAYPKCKGTRPIES